MLTRWPRRPLFLVGIFVNLSLLAAYLLTRTVGVPFAGPHAGAVEGFEFVGLCAAVSELGTVLVLSALIMRDFPYERKVNVFIVLTTAALLVGHLLHLLAGGDAAGHGT